jgi:co-chaperonin GroES (HSP10)
MFPPRAPFFLRRSASALSDSRPKQRSHAGCSGGTSKARTSVSGDARCSPRYAAAVLDPVSRLDIVLEPLDDYVVVQPLDETETATGLIVPINEAAQCATGIVVSVGPDVNAVEPGDKVLYPRDGGYEVRLVRSSQRVRVLRRDELIARIHD